MNIYEQIITNKQKLNYDKEFLEVLSRSFKKYIETSARSNEKLKILHGFIASTLQGLLGEEYKIYSLGYGDDKEHDVAGRYMPKKVDITIEKNGKIISGIAVKFVMSNYMQNSNNYFENMLGETANIRSKNIPYFQIFVIPDKIPYFEKDGTITKWEEINVHNISKYIVLSNDSIDTFMHTPNKTLFAVVHIENSNYNVKNKDQYKNFFKTNYPKIVYSSENFSFGSTIIYNNFTEYINKVCYSIKAI